MDVVQLSIIIPTFNEAPNVVELVRRVSNTVRAHDIDAEVIFVDDSTDDTPARARETAKTAGIPVRMFHRVRPRGGLGGAVLAGIGQARSDVCLVMDGDLQHPPEDIPLLYQRMIRGDVDVVVASRYAGGGTARGLTDRTRVLISKVSTTVTKAMFPLRLKDVSDPMTGFFIIDRRAIDTATLTPRGFKILLEILARRQLRIAEVPFDFARRFSGDSKATVRQGVHFLTQLTALRFGKMSLFAVIGGIGAVANLAIMWLLTQIGVNYVVAAVVASEVTIVGNFLLAERFVYRDMTGQASGVWVRFAKSFTFNNAEALIRIPVLTLMVESGHFSSVIAGGLTLAAAFVLRFVFHSLVVYAPRKPQPGRVRRVVEELDAQAVSPGEL